MYVKNKLFNFLCFKDISKLNKEKNKMIKKGQNICDKLCIEDY